MLLDPAVRDEIAAAGFPWAGSPPSTTSDGAA